MKKFLTILFLLTAVMAEGQYAYKNNKTELVRRNDFMKLSGWHFSPGVTWMGTRFRNTRDILFESGDTSYSTTFDPGGRIGLYFEVGRHHIFKYAKIFPYIDYGIAYKSLRGKESFVGEWYDGDSEEPFATSEGSGKFAHHNLLAYVNINNIVQLTNTLFIQNSFGLNIDYSIIKNSDKPSYSYQSDVELPRLWAQLHYKFGLGIKISDKFFIIPAIETPIFNLSPWTDFRFKVDQYMSQYRPLILSIRLAFLSQNNTDCPPVYDPASGPKDDPNYR